MNLWRAFSLRVIVLMLLWLLPFVAYIAIGIAALYQTGWLIFMAWSLPLFWLLAWLVGRYWPAPTLKSSRIVQPLTPREFWTTQDSEALRIVEQFRSQLPDIDRTSIADPSRYFGDAQALSQLLATHYHGVERMGQADRVAAYHPLTVVELLAVIHLSIEDLEQWMIDKVPGSTLVTLGQLEKVPAIVNAIDLGQKLIFVATSLANPGKLLSYPLWRGAGRVTVELQNEVMRGFYQYYLRQVSFYLIEMYSGRLRGGSAQYRVRFGKMSDAMHVAGGNAEWFNEAEATDTTIAVMGQVKAGKSSLINALMRDVVAQTSILPETRHVQRYELNLAPSDANDARGTSSGPVHKLVLLDTPGYEEADITRQQRGEIQTAVDLADIVLLVLSASSPAKDADLQMLQQLREHYQSRPHLKAPPILAILTHIDQLRPVREWQPPYNWQQPKSPKEQSIAQAAAYTRQLLGPSIAGLTCVYTGVNSADATGDSTVADEVVPLLVEQLGQGRAVAVLKAFYKGLSQRRYQQLIEQVSGLVKQIFS